MVKVEMNVGGAKYSGGVEYSRGINMTLDPAYITALDALPKRSSQPPEMVMDVAPYQLHNSANEYYDGAVKENEIMLIINEFVDERKVTQRKIDAARKRLKRLTNKLNDTEHDWEKQWQSPL